MDRRSVTGARVAAAANVAGTLLALLVLPHCSSPADPDEDGAAREAQAVTAFSAGVYTIAHGRAFAVDGGYYHWSSTTTEALYTLTAGNTYQQWQFTASGNGFSICNVGDGGKACLSDGGGSLAIGVGQDVFDVAVSGSGYTLHDERTGRYITDAASPANGAQVPTSSTASSWSLASIGGFNAGTYSVSDATTFAIDGGYYHFSQLATEELYTLTAGNTYQQWQFAASGSGFTICNVGDGGKACLSDGGSTLAIGVATDVWTVAHPAGGGSGYTLQDQKTGRFITDAASPADGAAVGVSSTATVWTLGAAGTTDAGVDSGVDAGTDSGPGASGFIATLDCAASSQPAICAYVSKNATAKSAAAPLSAACQHPTNTVQVNPGNFQSATAGAKSGQTLVFANGTYQGAVTIQPGVTYCGNSQDPSQVVIDNGTWAFFASGAASNVVIDGFTFGGGGVALGNGGDTLYVQNNVFDKPAGNWLSVGIWLANASHATLARNRFVCLPKSTGIDTWAVTSVAITDNSFSGCDEGMHINYPGTTSGVRIARNTFVEGHRIMMELQSGLSGMLVEDNLVVFPAVGGYSDTYGMGISLALPGSSAPVVRNNWLFGPTGNYKTLGVLGLELAGTNVSVSGNVLQYWNAGTSISDDGPSMSLIDNSYCDVLAWLTKDGGFNGWPNTQSGNSCVEAGGYAAPVP